MTAIASLTLNKFRGVVDELTLSFVKNGKPASVLVVGDNGSGKSSIIDGIEFCLQGNVYQKAFDDPSVPTLRNLYALEDGPSVCSVQLADGREFSRSTRHGVRHRLDNPAVEDFSYSGFVLRRGDLLRFTQASDRERSTRLASFIIRWSRDNWLEENPRAVDLNQTIDALKRRRRVLEDELASLLQEDLSHFPRSQAGLEEYVIKLRGGHPKMDKTERRSLPPVPIHIARRVEEVRRLHVEIATLGKKLYAEQTGRSTALLASTFQTIGDEVTSAFLELAPQAAFVKQFVFSASLPAVKPQVQLPSGQVVSPNKVLSEASLDVLALLTYLYLVKAASKRGQAKVLVLDDIFASADATVRSGIAKHLYSKFGDWQLICSFHDRLWYEQFRRAAGAEGYDPICLEFGRWRPDVGPTIYQAPQDASVHLRRSLDSDYQDRFGVALQAGVLLETICDFLTVNLSSSLPRRLSQSYNLRELWGPIRKALLTTSLASLVQRLDALIHLRNLVGAHHTEWARNITLDEVTDFAQVCLELWDAVFCAQCHNYVSRRAGTLRCPCGRTAIPSV